MPDGNTASPPDERFDVLNEDGSATGVVKRRADVHRDGDWHRAFHLWIVGHDDNGECDVLFQRRSARKDTWPQLLDIAVGGHFRAGESIHDVIREIDEEVGVQPELSDLVFIGERRAVSLTTAWQDRELQEVYVLALRDGWPHFAPNADEIESLVRVDVSELLRLYQREMATIPASVAPVIAERELGEWHPSVIRLDDFVPTSDGYLAAGAAAAARVLVGHVDVSLEQYDAT